MPLLSDPAERARRHALLASAHMAPLRGFCAGLRAGGARGDEVPEFDPLDGGTGARLLLLLEKPGPGTSPARGGSGFVSRDNPDPTAAATRRFLAEAGTARDDTIIWNTAPWWNGTIRFTAAERARGLAALPHLLALLPRLSTVILAGNQAARVRPSLEGRGLSLHVSAHPSPQVRAAMPERWGVIPAIWAEAARSL